MKQLALAIDQFLNCLFSVVFFIGGGWADESFSARCWREGKFSKGWNAVRIGIDVLFWFDSQHCFSSYLSEAERKQLPEEYRR